MANTRQFDKSAPGFRKFLQVTSLICLHQKKMGFLSELAGGALAGVAQTLVGHPFDTIKTRMQQRSSAPSRFVWKGLYRGALPAFYSSIYLNASLFPLLSYFDGNEEGRVISGTAAGVIVSPFLFELDRKKILLQTSTKVPRTIAGLALTAARESVGMCTYWTSYVFLRNEKEYHPLFAGGVAGVLSWGASYNLDVLKTRTIAGESLKEAIKRGRLWKGLPITLCRAFVVNAFVFYAYELGKKAVN